MVETNKEYIGTVVFNEDPTFAGRCKVRVFGLLDELSDEQLPWFYPHNSVIFSSSQGHGSISVPKIGSIVRINFPGGDIYAGEYTCIQTIDPALIEEIRDDYQGTHILTFDSEKNLIVGYQPMTGFKIWLDGSMVKVDADGSIQLKHKNNSNVIELTDRKINITTASSDGTNMNGEINIVSGATINVNAPTVNVESQNINLGGQNAIQPAVKGTALKLILQAIVTELSTKFPQQPSLLTGKSFDEILSENVTIL
jgi:hypothetical protein